MSKKYTRAFVTGSYAYGDPVEPDEWCSECKQYRNGSDIDLVVLVSKEDLEQLRGLSSGEHHSGDITSASLSFGRLNLICETDDEAFGRWKIGTRAFKRCKNIVPRSVAVNVFENLRLNFWHSLKFFRNFCKERIAARKREGANP